MFLIQQLESHCRSEYNALKHWIDIQQKLEHILTKLTKEFDQTVQYHNLLQMEEFSKNLTFDLNKQESIENILKEARNIIESLDQSSQDNIIHTIERYEIRWKDIRERLYNKLNEIRMLNKI